VKHHTSHVSRNQTFPPVYFGMLSGISGKFGRAMHGLYSDEMQLSQIIPMARPNTNLVRRAHKGSTIKYFNHTQIWPGGM